MPSKIICTESIVRSIPINLSIAVAPLRPSNAKIAEEATSKTVEAAEAIKTADDTVIAECFSENRIAIEIALGPAIRGIAIGTMSGDSTAGSSVIRREGKSMPKAIKKRTIPPVSCSEYSFNPSALSKLPPKNVAINRMAVAIAASRNMINRFLCAGMVAKSVFKTTKFPKGSIMRNSSSAMDIILPLSLC